MSKEYSEKTWLEQYREGLDQRKSVWIRYHRTLITRAVVLLFLTGAGACPVIAVQSFGFLEAKLASLQSEMETKLEKTGESLSDSVDNILPDIDLPNWSIEIQIEIEQGKEIKPFNHK